MRFFLAKIVIGVILVAGLGGCSGGEPEDTEQVQQLLNESTPGQLVEEFTMMALDPATHTPEYRRFVILDQLASMGPKTLTPIIDLMAGPETSNDTRLFILQSLAKRLTPLYMDDLTPLLVSENHVIRACAVTLIGHIDHPDVMALLEVARKDSALGVSFSALSGMAIRGDQKARGELYAMYFDEEAELFHKREIVRVILLAPVTEDLDILTSALIEDYVSIKTRALVAGALAIVGDSSSIEPLEKSLEKYTDPIFIQFASGALETIRQREEETAGGGR
jgi:hypothetical protein